MIFPAPEWTPDRTGVSLGDTSDVILNVVADVDSYRPWPQAENLTGPLDERARGAIAAVDSARNAYDYAGDSHDLYRLVSLSWVRATNVTLSATWSYSTSTDQWWEFEQWGNTVLATNGHDPVQEITLGQTNFSDLAGAPPVAYHMAAVRDFMWLGNIATFPQRVQWCAINDTHSWTVDAATQADFQDLPGDGGHVQRIIGGDTATVFQESAIWRAHYVGSPGIFDFGTGPIVKNIGLMSAQSAVRWGSITFFLSEGGFYRLDHGAIAPIGTGKIDRTFFSDLDPQYPYRVQAVIDPEQKLYVVCAPGAGNIGGNPNRIWVYNFEVGRWTVVNEDAEMLWRFISTAYTLEGLDNVSTSIDLLQDSLDSGLWAGGIVSQALFGLLHRGQSLTGAAKNAQVTTSEFAAFPGKRAKITLVRPLVDDNAASITPITRNRLADSRTIGTEVPQNDRGDCPIRANAHYFSFLVKTTGEFTRIRGAEVLEASDAGNR